MAVGFGTEVFDVFVDQDGRLPFPSPDATGLRTYEASVRLPSGTTGSDLRALQSAVTIMPAMGQMNAGTIAIEAGPGVRTLTYPAAGGELTADAILIGITETAHVEDSTAYFADLTFLVLE